MIILLILCSLIYAFYILSDLVPVFKGEKRRVFWVYLVLFCTSYILHVMIVLNIKIPSPAVPIKKLILSIFS